MQTTIQVISSGSESLRDRIVKDNNLRDFGLEVSEQKKIGRKKGWAKMKKAGAVGALNFEWHAASQLLICRIVTKADVPCDLAGSFVSYLLARFSKRIVSIRILRPD